MKNIFFLLFIAAILATIGLELYQPVAEPLPLPKFTNQEIQHIRIGLQPAGAGDDTTQTLNTQDRR